MDVVKTLLRLVVRGFYDLPVVLVMDALLVHSVLSEEDLHLLLGIQKKELRAICARLKEDHLLVDHVTKDEGPSTRPITKTFYYIHYTEAIDSVKWKMHQLQNKIKINMGIDSQPQGFVCSSCGTKYSLLDAVTNTSDDGTFHCDLCGSLLIADEQSTQSQRSQELLASLMSQIRSIVDTLKVIDDSKIEENTYETSKLLAVPVPSGGELPKPSKMGPGSNKLSSDGIKLASGVANKGTSGFEVSITSDKDNSEAEKKLKEEKQRLAQENALPAWYQNSTVGASFDATPKQATSTEETTSKTTLEDTKPIVDEVDDKQDEEKAEATLAEFYAQLAAKQAEEDDDDEDEDDDDMEFEDVAVASQPAPVKKEDNNDDDEDDDDDVEFEDL